TLDNTHGHIEAETVNIQSQQLTNQSGHITATEQLTINSLIPPVYIMQVTFLPIVEPLPPRIIFDNTGKVSVARLNTEGQNSR
ncbi:hypothetical protein BWZ30_12305, partial [Neisseria meningitidis]